MTTFSITAAALVATTQGRAVKLEGLEAGYKVRALVQMGIGGEVARAFGFSGGELSTVKMLAKRRKVIQ